MKHLISRLLILFVHSAPSIDYDNLNYRTIDIEGGLSDNLIQNSTQDKYGFMWFATLNGLNRYDGYRFKQYYITTIGDNNNDIKNISAVADGNLWLKDDFGFYFYDRETDLFTTIVDPIL